MLAGQVNAQESFRVELGRDGETIADMRPVFLKFESRPLPAISPTEVARRYQRLFETSDEPEVRVDALNRLTNIRDRSGQDIGFSPEEEETVYRQVIESYESILAKGAFSGRLDELIYQMAKAHALTGQPEASVSRLKQLVGLYPDSPLVPEARFRIAESAFSAGDYAGAETGYLALIDSGQAAELTTKAHYMLGWSQFKQGPSAWERAGKTFLSVLDDFLPTPQSLQNVPESSVDTIDDTFRVLALMAARRNGADTLLSWLGESPSRHWEYLLFDRLADYYAVKGEFEASVAVNKAFVRHAPGHPENPAFMAQVADVWARAGQADNVRGAKADYVAMFGTPAAYSHLDEDDRARWQQFSRQLADFHYHRAEVAAQRGNTSGSQAAFSQAAGFYEALAARTTTSGEVLRLAGDARLQAADYTLALADFQQAAYQSGGYPEAADAGWAAVVLLRDGVDGLKQKAGFTPGLAALSDEAGQFASQFATDTRLPGLQADLANRWVSAGDNVRALNYSQQVVTNEHASGAERYAGWLVTARVRQRQSEYGLAERAWNHALELIETGRAGKVTGDQTAALKQQLATAIYRQGEQAAASGKAGIAVGHFKRIGAVLPGSEIAIKGRFDAANTLLNAGQFAAAIGELTGFRENFPKHPLAAGVSDKLVYAYSESGQPLSAASELLNASASAADPWPDKLRAAALFHEAGATKQRDDLYVAYLNTRPAATTADQHVQLQTMRQRLVESNAHGPSWREALVNQELASEWHSEQTLQWAARGALVLGAKAAATFASIELAPPLDKSLDHKQKALEAARTYFLEAENFGGEGVRSESLYRRAELYRALARDLMASSVPGDLNELEAMQYQILLEEEAFPFEEKAIRLHSENHQRIASQGYDAWIGKSLGALAELNPGRYSRSVRWMSWNMEANDGA
jgi:TolA-binding protein